MFAYIKEATTFPKCHLHRTDIHIKRYTTTFCWVALIWIYMEMLVAKGLCIWMHLNINNLMALFLCIHYTQSTQIGRSRDIRKEENARELMLLFSSSVPLHFDHGLKSEYDQSNDLFWPRKCIFVIYVHVFSRSNMRWMCVQSGLATRLSMVSIHFQSMFFLHSF